MKPTLLVSSGGGHLKQLYTLAGRLGIPPEEQFWVTFDNGLSRSLLADRRVEYAPFAGPRDGLNIFRIATMARRILAENDFARAISTGSSPAVAFLPQASRRGIPSHYIESAARADGPSVSGKIISRFAKIATYTQYPVWSDKRWQYRGSIFDAHEQGGTSGATQELRRAVVSVGTQDGYSFDRLYANLAPLLTGMEVLWQTGPQDVTGFGITNARASVPHAELSAAVARADVVIAHAGTGAALTAIEAGKCPILVPRLARYNEHIDDHQLQIAAELHRRGLAISTPAEKLSTAVLHEAAARSTLRVDAPPFYLDELAPAKSPRRVGRAVRKTTITTM